MSGLPVATTTVPSGGARFAAAIEPIAGGDAAPLVLAERRLIARMVEQRLDGLGISVVRKLGAGEHLGPFLGGVLEPHSGSMPIFCASRSLDRTNDRLSRLFHAGYIDRPRAQLDRFPSAGSSHFVYALADRGARLLIECDGVMWGSLCYVRQFIPSQTHSQPAPARPLPEVSSFAPASLGELPEYARGPEAPQRERL
jgi:hypothetical protein